MTKLSWNQLASPPPCDHFLCLLSPTWWRPSFPKRAATHSTNQPSTAGFEATPTGFYVYVTVGLGGEAPNVWSKYSREKRKQTYRHRAQDKRVPVNAVLERYVPRNELKGQIIWWNVWYKCSAPQYFRNNLWKIVVDGQPLPRVTSLLSCVFILVLKDTLAVWRHFWRTRLSFGDVENIEPGALQRYLSPGGESPTWREKKKIEKMSPQKWEKRLSRPKKAKKWGQNAVKWEKENSYHREEEKKTDNKIKKRGHKSE